MNSTLRITIEVGDFEGDEVESTFVPKYFESAELTQTVGSIFQPIVSSKSILEFVQIKAENLFLLAQRNFFREELRKVLNHE